MNNKKNKVVIIGGSTGMGLATAKLAVEKDYEVIIASRSHTKLETAKKEIASQHVSALTVDVTDNQSIANFLAKTGTFNHLVIAGSEIKFGDIQTLTTDEAQESFNSKFFGAYRLIKQCLKYIDENGSITLFSGSAGVKPEIGSEVMSAINAAIEGFARGLAISLAPIRINTIAPGLIDTPIYKGMDKETRDSVYSDFTKTQPISRPGTAKEVAKSVMHLIENNYITGITLPVDGGHVIS